MKQKDDWIQTDGSSGTLQYGRKINDTSWQYREWVDVPYLPVSTLEDKLFNWEDGRWREDTIDLKDYTYEQIKDALSTYGYELLSIDPSVPYGIIFTQSGDEYQGRDAVQLACECIFELEIY